MTVMAYLWVKAFHVVAVISWMAGILYFWRLLVYHAMETETVVIERFKIMERRLRRAIMNPAAVAAIVLGSAMIGMQPSLLRAPWFVAKLLLVLLLISNHILALVCERRLAQNVRAFDHKFFRVMNEVPTLLMILIVILVVLKPALGAR